MRIQTVEFSRRAWMFVGVGLLVNALFVASPLFRTKVPGTLDMDLANHVRHVHEYTLALSEGQLLPLTAPALNGRLRYPLFQFYTGTAYTVPGLLGLTGLNPFFCLTTTILTFSFLAALALFRVFEHSLGGFRAAYLGASTFQLFGFAGVDLYVRGGYPEWLSLHLAVLVLWTLCGLADACAAPDGRRLAIRVCLAVAALVLFIPCHPSQTVYTGLTVLILAGAYALDRLSWRALAVAVVLAGIVGVVSVLLTGWFWFPIFADYAHLRITGYLPYLHAAGEPWVLLWPWHRTGYTSGWAPQVGPHLVAAAVLAVLTVWKNPQKAQSLASAGLVLVFCFLVVLPFLNETNPCWQSIYTVLQPWVRPMQWSYRFLMPCSLAGALAVALVCHRAESLRGVQSHVRALFAVALLFLAVNACPYYYLSPLQCQHGNHLNAISLDGVLADRFDSRNVTLGYALHGMDYRSLHWRRDGGLVLDHDFVLPFEAVPFETGLLLSDPDCPLTVSLNGKPLPTRSTVVEGGRRMVSFDLYPIPGWRAELHVQFHSPRPTVPLASLQFRPLGEQCWIQLPEACELASSGFAWPGGRVVLRVQTASAGGYQLPFCYHRGLRVRVNGRSARLVSWADRYLYTAHLPAGESIVEVRSLPAGPACRLGAAGLALLGLLLTALCVRRRVVPPAQASAPRAPLAQAG